MIKIIFNKDKKNKKKKMIKKNKNIKEMKLKITKNNNKKYYSIKNRNQCLDY